MNHEIIRQFCLSLPHATEEVLWEKDLVFKIGGKMFAVLPLEISPTTPVQLSLKCTPEEFAELCERDGIFPAPYAARYHWVALERWNALRQAETKRLIQDSYQMVYEKLPKKIQQSLPRS
ncbi:MAG: MmcQ/YjbR family DNA-binding protein [Acidobacteria bacterium]|nr:MmcQ/YjbR family DNA-binding protein [Acidobacteriota bacterium]